MKELAILLLAAVLLNGCSTSTTTAQTAASGVWNAELLGGSGEASGLSFTTQFTVSSNNSLNITFFQLLTQGSCFAVTGGTQTGTMTLTTNSTTMAVTGPFSYTEQSQGNTLTLTGAVTGTESGTTLSGGSITGTWAVTGGTGCNASNGTFTMKQTS